MSYVLPYIFLLGGFVLLVKGADVFVEGSSGIARFFKIPSLIIGLTIVAFGTSAPEAAVSITASITGQTGIAVGNVSGSNIFNILAVLGVCAMIRPIHVHRSIMNRDYLLMLIACAMFFAVSADMWLGTSSTGIVSRGDGIVLALLFCVFMYMTIQSGLKGRKEAPKLPDEPHEAPQPEKAEKPVKLPKSIIMAVLGLAGVIIGGQLVVNGASAIAKSFGASETLIGVTVVAIGTSLPELVTSIMASRKGENDMAVGNVIGSNLFNVLFVIAASSIISPLTLDMESVIDMIIMLGVSIMVYFFAVTKQKINRVEGGIMTALYIAYTAFAIVR
ncbi:MAG: calcium/sodium antiporter [Oscillospiraceae bacterium]|nr:calcium/sodium antiporter [Oscillospiraceae bacterium]